MCARPLCDCVRGALARQLASHVSVRIVCPEGGRGIRWRAVGGSRRDPPRRCARRVAGRGGPFTVRLRSLGFVCRGARRRVSCCGVHGGAVAGTPSRLRPGRAPREWCGAGGGRGGWRGAGDGRGVGAECGGPSRGAGARWIEGSGREANLATSR